MGDLKSVMMIHQNLEPGKGIFREAAGGHQETDASVRASSHTTPQLMKLREAEALRMLNDHEGGLGDMNPNFHNRCPYEEMYPACPEVGHHGFPFLGR